MNEGFVQAVKERIMAAANAGMVSFVQIHAAKMQDLISTPVEYTTGPRGGVIVTRSQPDEPPRLETTELYESIQSEVRNETDKVVGTIYTNCPYARALDLGREEINLDPRPWWTPSVAAIVEDADSLKAMISENFGSSSLSPAFTEAS